MSFTRTKSGLSNLHLFYDSDITIFTEGGSHTFTYKQVENGEHNKQSVDIKFWKYVLDANGFQKKVNFRAIGSKTTARAICDKIINDNIRNVAVAKDRDLDDYMEGILHSPFILYTKGYSWENDVFTKDITLSQVNSMIMMQNIPDEVKSIINQAYEDFRIFGKNLAKLEVMFRKKGISFISDLNGERFFNCKQNVSIDREQVLSILVNKKEELDRPITLDKSLKGICPFLNNYGKLIEALSLTIISYVCRQYADHKSIPKNLIVSAMMEKFANKISQSRDKYYSHLVASLQAA